MPKWATHSTAKPERFTNIMTLVASEMAGQEVSASELCISYHFIDEALAQEIAANALKPEQAKLFHQMRAISYTAFETPRAWWQFWIKPHEITWFDFAERCGHDDSSFWVIWEGAEHRIIEYLKPRVRLVII